MKNISDKSRDIRFGGGKKIRISLTSGVNVKVM